MNPMKSGSVAVIIRRPGRAPFRAVSLETLTDLVRIYRKRRMTISKADLQAKRQKAMGVAGTGMQAAADMYDRVIAAGQKVTDAVQKAEAAQMGAINQQVADLEEVATDVEEFGQAATNPPGTIAPATAAPAKTTATPSAGSAALAALQSAQPGNLDSHSWTDGNAYHETNPEPKAGS